MDIYDKVAELALSIRETPEFVEWLRVKELVDQTIEEKNVLQKYRTYQLAMEFADMTDASVSYMESANDELDELYDIMMKNPLLSRYLHAEECFCFMLNKMQQIFAKHMDFPTDDFFAVHETDAFLN